MCLRSAWGNRKRVLRRKESRVYFNGDGWTADPAEARSFVSAMQAAQACAELGLITVDGLVTAELVWHLEPARSPGGC